MKAMLKTPLRLGPIRVGAGAPLALIAGPCVLEDETLTLRVAARLAGLAGRRRIPLVFKASWDKANRTSAASYRGPGLAEGLRLLGRVRRETGLPVLTDVHETSHVDDVAAVADVLQVPAFLARQTDLLVACGRSGRAVNVKKGPFMAPEDMVHAVEKVRGAGGTSVLVTERGAVFGYHDLVVDMRSLPILAGLPAAVVFDASHSVQRPAGRGASSGGDRTMIPPLVRAACAVGVDALFVEVHPDPARAKSDGPNAWPLARLEELWDQALAADRAARSARR
jgi:2-dehydro-3-deoxyphosphooctonate aldolase (KDO 8-P synthase)